MYLCQNQKLFSKSVSPNNISLMLCFLFQIRNKKHWVIIPHFWQSRTSPSVKFLPQWSLPHWDRFSQDPSHNKYFDQVQCMMQFLFWSSYTLYIFLKWICFLWGRSPFAGFLFVWTFLDRGVLNRDFIETKYFDQVQCMMQFLFSSTYTL